jgi:hypothetical protein
VKRPHSEAPTGEANTPDSTDSAVNTPSKRARRGPGLKKTRTEALPTRADTSHIPLTPGERLFVQWLIREELKKWFSGR